MEKRVTKRNMKKVLAVLLAFTVMFSGLNLIAFADEADSASADVSFDAGADVSFDSGADASFDGGADASSDAGDADAGGEADAGTGDAWDVDTGADADVDSGDIGYGDADYAGGDSDTGYSDSDYGDADYSYGDDDNDYNAENGDADYSGGSYGDDSQYTSGSEEKYYGDKSYTTSNEEDYAYTNEEYAYLQDEEYGYFEIEELYIEIMPLGAYVVADWGALQSALTAPFSANEITVTLAGNIQMGGAITIPENIQVTIVSDGNAIHTIQAANNQRHFVVNQGGTLTLGDASGLNSQGNNFTLQGSGVVASVGGGSIFVNGGTLRMYGGTITGATNSNINAGGGAIHLNGSSTFYMHGGIIENNSYTGGSSGGGGGVNLMGTSKFEMQGGIIRNNAVTDTRAAGGGVGIHGGGNNPANFTMTGGEIYGNWSVGIGGGGVNVTGNGGAFNMSGGTIRDNWTTAATGNGGGVRIIPGNASAVPPQFNMSGTAQIIGNEAVGNGGGVFLGDRIIFNMSGNAKIVGNETLVLGANGGGVFMSVNSTLNMSGNARIEDNETLGHGGGVFMNGSSALASALSMSDNASISGNTAGINGGGIATHDSANNGFAITLNGGTISGNTANGAGTANGGGGIFMRGALSVLTINDGATVYDNEAIRGGGVMIHPNTAGTGITVPATHNHFVINGGLIDDNTANIAGGGIHLHNTQPIGVFMTNGIISNNEALTGNGGGISIHQAANAANRARLDITGGTISNNEAVNGGGIGFIGAIAADTTLPTLFIPFLENITIGSDVTFANNTASGGLNVSAYLSNRFGTIAQTITPSATPHGNYAFTNHDIHTPLSPRTVTFVVVDSDNVAQEISAFEINPGVNFTNTVPAHLAAFPTSADVRGEVDYTLWPNAYGFGFNEWGFNGQWAINSTGGAIIDRGNFSIPMNADLRLYAQIDQLLIVCPMTLREAVRRTTAGNPAVLVMQNSFGNAPSISPEDSVTILADHDITIVGRDGANFTYYRARGGLRHFVVNTDAILRLNNVTLYGTNHIGNIGGGVRVNPNGTLYVNEGARIENNRASLGGGVQVDNGGTVNINGGTITRNTASSTSEGGGGVFLTGANSVLTMSDNSVISDNLGRHGGGIRMNAGSIVHMNGGSIEQNNTNDGRGGGVSINNATFNMNAGQIYDNTSATTGGGVSIESAGGSLIMQSGAVISNNTATGNGGGVNIIGASGILNINGGTISNNTTNVDGGGIASAGTVNFASGYISGNAAGGQTNGGGGVFLTGATSNFTMGAGATIGGGNNARHGGGVRMNAGTFTMNGGEIRDNFTVEGRGGGVSIAGGTFTMSGGSIVDNTSATIGGGVGLEAAGAFNMSGGSIEDNTARRGGGLGFNLPAAQANTMEIAPFVPFLNRVTIGAAATFSGNEATEGLQVNAVLPAEFASTISPSDVTYGEHAFTDYDIHSPLTGHTVTFVVIDRDGNEIPLGTITGITPNANNNFSATLHAADFPTSAAITAAGIDYTTWENEFGFGFNEWSFNDRWRIVDPTTGTVIVSEDFSVRINENTRVYAYFEQLLINNDANLREAVSRTSAGVPALIIMQNSFDVDIIGSHLTTPSVVIPTGHDIMIAGLGADNETGEGGANVVYSRAWGNANYYQDTQRHFIVDDGATLRLNNITVRGTSTDTRDAFRFGGILVEGSGELHVNEGTIIEGNRAIYGGGISIRATDVRFAGQQNTAGGGGNVFISDATVRNNRGTSFGGGIAAIGYIIDSHNPEIALSSRPDSQLVTVTVSGNSVISYNNSHYAGGGIMIQHFARLTLDNGTIRNNETRGWGGGVRFHNGGSFNMHGGVIRDNTANYGGGGVGGGSGPTENRMQGVAIFNMSGGEIRNNNVTGTVAPQDPYSSFLGGGGVMVDGWIEFTMNGGEIHNNYVPTIRRATPGPFGYNPFGMGGGVFLNHGARFTINNNAQVRDNNAYRGGGIHVATIEASPLHGFAYRNTWLFLNDARITGNTARENGGGIFATYYPNIRVSDRIIFSGNTAASLHSFFNYPTFGTTFVVEAGQDSGEGQGGYAGWSNINWATVSVAGTHALSNYDINFIWTPADPRFIRVVFNPNGGVFTGNDQLPIRPVELGGTFAPAFNAADNLLNDALTQPTREGFTFGGWFNSEANANNLASQDGRLRPNMSHDDIDMFMLWARWIPAVNTPPINTNPSDPPTDPPADDENGDENGYENGYENGGDDNGYDNGYENGGDDTYENGGTNPLDPTDPTSPPVTEGENVVVTEEGNWIVFDEQGVPLGQWTWDEEQEMWIFEDLSVPLGLITIPQTGVEGNALNWILFGLAALAMLALVLRRKSKADIQ